MPTIDELKGMASSRLGFARTNQYLVEFPSMSGGLGGLLGRFSGFIPSVPGLVGDNTASSRELNVLCKNVDLPGKQILATERNIGMVQQQIAYGYAITDVSMTFYLLNDYGVMNYINAWKSKVVDENNFTAGYKNDYAKPIKIHQLRKPLAGLSASAGPIRLNLGFGGGSVYSVELIDAFPRTINSIALSNDLDGLVEVTVSFSYTNWKRISAGQNWVNLDINPGQIF